MANRSSKATGGVPKMRLPAQSQVPALRTFEDWAFLAVPLNRRMLTYSFCRAYEATGLRTQFGAPDPDLVAEIKFALLGGERKLQAFKRSRVKKRRELAALASAKTWQAWLESYLALNPRSSASRVSDAMLREGFERLGAPPDIDAIEALQATVGAGGMNAKKLADRRTARRNERLRISRENVAKLGRVAADIGARPPWLARSAKHPRLDERAFLDAVRRRNGSRTGSLPNVILKRQALTPLTTRLFETLKLPKKLRAFFGRHSYSLPLTIGDLVFSAVNQMASDNLAFDSLLRAGFLRVGMGANGDPIALDLHTGTVGFLNQHEVWTDDEDVDARQHWVDMRLDLGAFFRAAVESHAGAKRPFPRDYHGARAAMRAR